MLTASDVYANPPPAAAAREPIVLLENVSVQYRVPKERIGTFRNTPSARCSAVCSL